MSDTGLQKHVLDRVCLAKEASRFLAGISTQDKNEALQRMAQALWDNRQQILDANRVDIEDAEKSGDPASRIDRLLLDTQRVEAMMKGLYQIMELPDPIGETLETAVLQNELRVEKRRVPLGVIAMIYESRPNVTVDAVGLTLKTGNAVVLRGGKESLRSNQALVDALQLGLRKSRVPVDSIQFVNRVDREAVDILIQARGLVDLAIPRGGAGLIGRVIQGACVPVIETGVGNCHIYVDADADLAKALSIILNAKTQRPSVCNAAETLLVHEAVADEWLPVAISNLLQHDVEIRGCPQTEALARQSGAPNRLVRAASEEDWATEFLAPILAIKVVKSADEAIRHITHYGTQHSEAIVTENVAVAEDFLSRVDAAVVYHNASTRFTDGFEFGFGAEIGISTQKLHARGPMGLRELTSYQYVVRGNGQVRQ
ncbi:glutamate-5-semialdehyde dehydrogenase [Alicyclobacillus dauci]